MSEEKNPKLLTWSIEQPSEVNGGKFVKPPRIIRVFENETCKFFRSDFPAEYIPVIDEIYLDGGSGELVAMRAMFKKLSEQKDEPEEKTADEQKS